MLAESPPGRGFDGLLARYCRLPSGSTGAGGIDVLAIVRVERCGDGSWNDAGCTK